MADILPSEDAIPFIDHTCVTPFERFAHSIEQHLRAWKIWTTTEDIAPPLPSSPTLSPVRQRTSKISKSVSVTFLNKNMSLELRHVQEPKPDSGLNGAALERFLGVLTCIYLSPASTSDAPVAKDACEASVLLSAMVIAAEESGCKLPVIVPIGDAADMDFIGRNAYKNVRYVCGSIPYPPSAVSHAAGLLELFAAKRMASRPLQFLTNKGSTSLIGDEEGGYVHITACFHYIWKSFPLLLNAGPHSFMADRHLQHLQSHILTEGDPVRDIEIKATWKQFPANSMGSNPSRWSFPPINADMWCLKANFRDLSHDMHSRYLLSKRLSAMRRMGDLVYRKYGDSCAAPLPLLRIETDPESFLEAAHDYVITWNADKVQGVDEVFFTAALRSLLSLDSIVLEEAQDALAPEPENLDSVHRLARFASSMNGRARVFRKLWALYLDGITARWEAGSEIPNIDSDKVDLHTVLLRQKLQMINCCIVRRKNLEEKRRNSASNSSVGEMPDVVAWDNAWSSDGEEQSSASVHNGVCSSTSAEALEKSGTNTGQEREHLGRKRQIPQVYLYGSSNDLNSKQPMYEPELQEHPLVTSDIAARISEELSNPNLTHTDRARIQSASLTSDMSAFKAANEGASLADFVRWFSPTDHSAESATEGEDPKAFPRSLSDRMSTPGNLWEELWKQALPVSVSNQEALFNPIESGLKALGDLRAMNLRQVVEELTILLASEGVSILTRALQKPPKMQPIIDELTKARVLVDSSVAQSKCSEGLLESLKWCEKVALRATALAKRIPVADVDNVADGGNSERAKILGTMCTGAEAKVLGIQQRRAIGVMAGLDENAGVAGEEGSNAHDRWRTPLLPHAREFVFEAPVQDCNEGDEEMVRTDRMYARNEESEFTVGFRLSLNYET